MAAKAKPVGRAGARERMLETAERLLGEYGIDGVSLRQIGAATGQGNNSAVQYHFGDKAGLVREIIARRVESFEPRRRGMLDRASALGKLKDVRTLLEIIFLPLAEAVDAEGRHVYARFMMQFLTRFQYEPGFTHPGWAPESAATQAALLLAKSLPFLSGDALSTRINRVGGLFFNALIDRDNAITHGKPVESEDAFFADLFAMMEAAARTPPSK
ncbi:MAG TPA: TetR/AcrR family transcriptional regulator [Alphaproteobacteria bacterium]|nr:TetR/AcrR family transcriptional regulator [Alphaproteobacteria bacterium]